MRTRRQMLVLAGALSSLLAWSPGRIRHGRIWSLPSLSQDCSCNLPGRLCGMREVTWPEQVKHRRDAAYCRICMGHRRAPLGSGK